MNEWTADILTIRGRVSGELSGQTARSARGPRPVGPSSASDVASSEHD